MAGPAKVLATMMIWNVRISRRARNPARTQMHVVVAVGVFLGGKVTAVAGNAAGAPAAARRVMRWDATGTAIKASGKAY